ncbi:hypothetical protein [Mycoavidus sp. SF9855]|uniref:hypothetical protein n=1 Tax=Mycoavidus sp. SF9855 TaxID=2968475 RepID=UPI00211CE15E|nr:hypothetical protein [Mycoavidus sp. SF9855]UUM20725.1 hypothetical protein NQD60_04350 [Mycoavidus sp. SF9855]
MFNPINGMFSRSNPVSQGQPHHQTPQQMLEQVQQHKEAADHYKTAGQVVEAGKHYEAAQDLFEAVMANSCVDFRTVKMLEPIYSNYSLLLYRQGANAEAERIEQKGRELLERYAPNITLFRKREAECELSSAYLNKKSYTAPIERPNQVSLPDEFIHKLEILSLHPVPLASTASFFNQDKRFIQPSHSYALVNKLEEIEEARHLVWCLQEGPKHHLDISELRGVADQILQSFAKSHFYNLDIVQELVALGPLDQVGVYRTIMNQLERGLKGSINLAALQGLAFMISHRLHLSQDEHLTADCVSLLGQLEGLLKLMHRKNNKLQLAALLQTMSLLLDTMYGALISEVSDSLKTSLDSLLKELQDKKNYQDAYLAFQAQYLLQALKGLKSDKEWGDIAKQVFSQFGGSTAYFAGAFQTWDPDKFWEGFQRFQEGVRPLMEKCGSNSSSANWYIALRYVDLFVERGWVTGIESFLSQGEYAKDKYFLQGLCDRLERIACGNNDESIKDSALRFLMSLEQGGERWGNHKVVKQYAAQTLNRIGCLWTPLTLEAMERLDYAPAAWHPFWQGKPSSRILKEIQETALHRAYARGLLPQIGAFRQEMNASYANLAQTVETHFIQPLGTAQTIQRGLVQVQSHVQELVPRGTGRSLDGEKKTGDLTDDQECNIEAEATPTSERTTHGEEEGSVGYIVIGDRQNAVKGSGNIFRDRYPTEADIGAAENKKRPAVTEAIQAKALNFGERIALKNGKVTFQLLIGNDSNSIHGDNNRIAMDEIPRTFFAANSSDTR